MHKRKIENDDRGRRWEKRRETELGFSEEEEDDDDDDDDDNDSIMIHLSSSLECQMQPINARDRRRDRERERDKIFVWRLRTSFSLLDGASNLFRSLACGILFRYDFALKSMRKRLVVIVFPLSNHYLDELKRSCQIKQSLCKVHELKTDWWSFLPLHSAALFPSLSIILFSWNSCRNNLIYNWLTNANFTTGETDRRTER